MRAALLHLAQLGGGGHALRIDQESDGGRVRDNLHEPLEARRFELLVEDGHPGEVPARPGEAADETDRDRVAAAGKGDGDGGGRGLGGARGGIAEGGDDRHVAGHQLGCQGRQPVELTVRPAKLEGDVAVRDVAPLGEAFLKRGHRARALVARMEEADHRHRRLLRARRERPCRAAEQSDELASLHIRPSSGAGIVSA